MLGVIHGESAYSSAKNLKNEENRSLISVKSISISGSAMDTELARTFLTVVAAGNFVSAAERLHVTQSTISARIQSLESSLGCRLFVRNKGGTTLTAEGRHFQ